MEQAVIKIRETSAHTVAAYPTYAMAQNAVRELASNQVPVQFTTIVAEGVRSESRSVGRGFRKVVALTLLGAVAAAGAEMITQYWLAEIPSNIDWNVLGWATLSGAIIGLLASLLFRTATKERPLKADIFEVMVSDQYAPRAREVLTAKQDSDTSRRDDEDERRTQSR